MRIALGIFLAVAGVAAIVSMIVLLWMVGAGEVVFTDPGAALGAGMLTFVLGIVSTVMGTGLVMDW